MSRFWSPVVHRLTPYVPGEQPRLERLIKLNTNENPYPPSPRVLEAIREASNEDLRLYPDPGAERLRAAIAAFHGVSANQVFVGNGSDEVLAHVFLGLLRHERPLLFPDITYSFYPVYCRLYEIAYRTVALDDTMAIQPDAYAQTNGGIILPNPNAPTGRALARAQIETLLQHNPDSVVVIDEAYVDFGGQSAITLTSRYPNLLVVQTLSKSRSLAGLRVGFAVGDPTLIEALERVKNSFNSYPLGRAAQAGAVAAFEDVAYFEHTCSLVMASRDWLTAELSALGFLVLPSAANFVFVQHPARDAARLQARLRAQGIVVRHFNLPRIDQFLRISIGTQQECATLVTALKGLLQGA